MEFSIWFLLWFVLSATLLYFSFWTLYILYRQKKAWRIFADKRGLRYESPTLLAPPRMDGVVDGYTVSFFASVHDRDGDVRRAKKLTTIELQLHSVMPIGGAVASGGMVRIIKEAGFREEVKPKSPLWKDSYVATTDHKAGLLLYLTEPRLKTMTDLMAIKNAWALLAFQNDVFFLRVDTPYPLDNPKMVDDLVKRMIAAAKIFELEAAEAAKIKAAVIKEEAVSSSAGLRVDDAEDTGGLELDEG